MDLLLLGAFLLVAVAIAFGSWYFSADRRALRAMKAVPLLPVGDVREGQKTRIVGRAELLETLTAPLTGRACAAWRVAVLEQRRSGKNSRWVTVLDEQESVDFLVLDGTSKALVKANDASVVLDKDWKDSSGLFAAATPELESFLQERGLSSKGFVFNKGMKYHEGVLEAGEYVAVVGVGRWERDPERGPSAGAGYREASAPRRLVMTSPDDDMLILSDEPAMLT
ncbi:MAG: hypothetical protein GXP55_23910 [Deltaproteobacteria bacterium]|nr:hypothetical protein [Deltaproteobacteria bacterium]